MYTLVIEIEEKFPCKHASRNGGIVLGCAYLCDSQKYRRCCLDGILSSKKKRNPKNPTSLTISPHSYNLKLGRTLYSDQQLLQLNHLGIIPGPSETAEAFAKRAEYCLHLKEHLSKELLAPFGSEVSQDSEVLDTSNSRLSTLYDIAPDWIPVFFSDYRLPFWQGGCAWIFQTSVDSPTAALIQLRQTFRHSECYLGLYQREELLTHELVHVGRMAFQEPRFEEVLAYRTAHTWFRKWCGPIVQSSVESVIFILLLGLIVVFDVFLVALNRMDAYTIALWLKLIPLVLVIYAFGRLFRRQRILDKCLQNIRSCFEKKVNPLAIAYRLIDKEIESFAKMSDEEIKKYMDSQVKKELRWRVISLMRE